MAGATASRKPASRAPPAPARAVAHGAPAATQGSAAALPAQVGNRGMQALLGALPAASRALPRPNAVRAPDAAATRVHAALAGSGAPLAEADALRLSSLLQAATHAAPLEPVRPQPAAWAAPVWVADVGSGHEVQARGAAEAARRLPGTPVQRGARRDAVRRARIHADAVAAHAARALRARAFVIGDHVFFDSGRYAPHTPQGERLLLHELVHVEQLAFDARGLLVLRDGEGEATDTAPSSATLTVTMDQVTFQFGARARYRAGPTRPQIWPPMLQRLLGTQYSAALATQVIDRLLERGAGQGVHMLNDLREDRVAREGEEVPGIWLPTAVMLLLIAVLEEDFDLRVDLSDEQRELLRVGFALRSAWPLLQPRVPRWYTEFMFRRQMADRRAMALDWQRMAPTSATSGEYGEEHRAGMIDTIFGALIGPIRIVEAMRTDYALGNAVLDNPGRELEQRYRVDGGVAWRILWNIDADEGRSSAPPRRVTAAPPEDQAHQGYALGLLNYVHTQPAVGEQAARAGAAGHDARLELLGRFQRFMRRAGSRIGGGDERLFDVPARATDPPWNATMRSAPPLTPPLFDAALETDHAFTMQLEFGTVFDAFAFYGYLWKFVRIPDPTSEEPVPDPLTAAGARPSFGAVWDTRLARTRRYNAADLERIRSRFGDTPWGQAVSGASFGSDLVRLNNALRTLGTVIHTVLERLTQPRNTTRIVFPEPGMYVVVCRAVPVLEGDEEVTRAPSVAMLPVVARDPDEMAVSRVREASRSEFQMQLRMAEIRALLDSPFPPQNAADLQAEMQELQALTAEPGAALVSRRDQLRRQIAALQRRLDLRAQIAAAEAATPPDASRLAALRRQLFEAGGELVSAYTERQDKRALERQLETVNDMIEMREARAAGETGARFTPHATFVSDLGATLALALEMYDRGDVDGEYQVYISDLTTPDSGATLGTSPITGVSNPRVTAVLRGVRELLESHSDYGRGRVALQIEGVVHTVRVEAGTGRMLMEGIENGVMVLSLAAIVAAPFTGGQSLMLLLPLGAVGAIPSAYRLYQRHDEHRLRFDLAAAMDVVNIVGGVIGLSHAATPLRMVRMGRVLMVAGLGADGTGMMMMGAGLVVQIEALRNLPEHERAARLLMILGGAMLQLGIQAGGMVMHARYQGAREAGAPVREGGAPHDTDSPGFRPPADTSGTPPVAPPRSPADRTAAGDAPPPPRPPPQAPVAPSRAARRRAAAHERLMARFESGIDYSRPPPATEVANPPPPGPYRRPVRGDQAAFRAYNDAIAVSAGREVGLFHNPRTGEYRVMMGDETGVSAPARSGWDAVVHYHPDGGTRLTFRLPSPHDFQGLMFRFLESGAHVREFVEFDIPGVGRGRTEYGIEPGHAEPFYVRIHRPNEAPQTLRFAHDGAFRAYWGERTVFVEPGSPLYEAMVRDIQDYVRSLDPTQAGPAPPARRTASDTPAEPGPRPEAGRPAPGDRTTAGTGAGSGRPASGRMTDAQGNLTDMGVALIRRRFRTVAEFGGRRRVSLDDLSDAEIRARFPTEWPWLEAVVIGETRQSWIGRTTATDFLLDNPQQTLSAVAARLDAAVAAGNTGHVVNRGVLDRNAFDFMRERVQANDPILRPLWDALEASTNPVVRREWDRFLFGNLTIPGRAAARRRTRQGLMDTPSGGGQGLGSGRVGDKQPDMLEVMLSQDTINVLDPSQRWSNPVHNFKTAFYAAVLRELINVGTLTATDVGSAGRRRQVTP